ncbi:Oidioi.mRNA.OKI2018_I69.XSR.g14738.t1.cds [Oikopleura dioica]|uniref:Oidioi.mRNA.OKI2018_I69.XSR.g14738.t1.cds n=1 Tax=Oikopleura dioica TaxID=34765 RepID=A0ABN7SFW9_OIKDI|nr:Oidioi.mRNA.OKI2018_I69.XSR.g14738.t1.cds [Oikopleura dioica]
MEPSVSLLGEGIRKVTPTGVACKVGCGAKCKHEQRNFAFSTSVVPRLSSSWIWPSKLLAIARPAEDFFPDNVKYFKSAGIRSIVNLQEPGEHEHCGTLLAQSGFTYSPERLMAEKISFYSYPTKDYGVYSVDQMFDICKVISFAISEGACAVHCHAGLGRTGVVCAAWLIFDMGFTDVEAFTHVRATRPGSIQSRPQIASVSNFFQVLKQLRTWPLKSLSVDELYLRGMKAYNKHEFGKNPLVHPFILVLRKYLSLELIEEELPRTMSKWIHLERVKEGAWNSIRYLSKAQLDQLLREWLSDLKEPLLPELKDAKTDKLSDVQLNTAKMVYSILEDLNMSQDDICVLLTRDRAASNNRLCLISSNAS